MKESLRNMLPSNSALAAASVALSISLSASQFGFHVGLHLTARAPRPQGRKAASPGRPISKPESATPKCPGTCSSSQQKVRHSSLRSLAVSAAWHSFHWRDTERPTLRTEKASSSIPVLLLRRRLYATAHLYLVKERKIRHLAVSRNHNLENSEP